MNRGGDVLIYRWGKRKSWILIWCRVLCGRLENDTRQQADCLTWHSYVASSIFCAVAIFSRQLFGYWKSTEYLGSPEYVCFPTVSSSSPFSPLFRRTHETCQASQMEKREWHKWIVERGKKVEHRVRERESIPDDKMQLRLTVLSCSKLILQCK